MNYDSSDRAQMASQDSAVISNEQNLQAEIVELKTQLKRANSKIAKHRRAFRKIISLLLKLEHSGIRQSIVAMLVNLQKGN